MKSEIADIASAKSDSTKIEVLKRISEAMKQCSISIDEGRYGIAGCSSLLTEIQEEFSLYIFDLGIVCANMTSLIQKRDVSEVDQIKKNYYY